MIKKVLFWLATLLVVFVVLWPLLWIYMTAFKSPQDVFSPSLKNQFLFTLTLENFQRLLSPQYNFLRSMLNTIVVSVGSTAIVLLVSLPAAYSFARWNTGKGHLLFTTISTRMFPGVVAAIPFFLMFRNLGLLDTHLGLILLYIYFNTSFATFLLYGYFREVPVELEHAALIDGFGRLDVFRKVVIPLILPGLAITAIFCLVWSWNEFLFAFLFTRDAAKVMTVLISSFWGSIEVQYGPMAAGAAIGVLPTLLAAWFMQRYIIRGLTFGAVKG